VVFRRLPPLAHLPRCQGLRAEEDQAEGAQQSSNNDSVQQQQQRFTTQSQNSTRVHQRQGQKRQVQPHVKGRA
jgi:hypothetical protein